MPASMTYTLEQIRRIAAAYCQRADIAASTLGSKICGNAAVLPQILTGGGCQARTLETITAWFDRNWPENYAWPRGVPRNPRAAARPARGAHAETQRSAAPPL